MIWPPIEYSISECVKEYATSAINLISQKESLDDCDIQAIEKLLFLCGHANHKFARPKNLE